MSRRFQPVHGWAFEHGSNESINKIALKRVELGDNSLDYKYIYEADFRDMTGKVNQAP